MKELKKDFPEGLDYRIAYDTTAFIRESIGAVIHTLYRGRRCSWCSSWCCSSRTGAPSLIPLVAVPVSLIGTFAAMAAFGFSINNLSLFGLVLAIGIVVDDAIVVVENVERHIAAGPRRRARRTHKAMDEVSGAVIAIALVLSAVFIPTAFISGITGKFYQQFALTIAVSTLISAFNSLTLSPALCALLLQPAPRAEGLVRPRVTTRWLGCSSRGSTACSSGLARLRPGAGPGAAALRRRAGGLCGSAGADLVWLPQGADRLHSVPGQGLSASSLPPAAGRRLAPAHGGGRAAGAADIIHDDAGRRSSPSPSLASLAQPRQRLERRHVRPPESVRGAQVKRGPDGGRADHEQRCASSSPRHPGGLRRRRPAAAGGRAGHAGRLQAAGRGPRRSRLPGAAGGHRAAGGRRPARPEISPACSPPSAPACRRCTSTWTAPRPRSCTCRSTHIFDTLPIYLGSRVRQRLHPLRPHYQVTAQADAPFRAKPDDVKNLKTRNASGRNGAARAPW